MLCFNVNGDSSQTSLSTPPITPNTGNQILSGDTSSSQTSPNHRINIQYETSLKTESYNEIWRKIHHESDSINVIESILQPDRTSIREVLDSATFTPLTRIVSNYLDSSEEASRMFLSLRQSVELVVSMYAPIGELLEIVGSEGLKQSQCDWALSVFQEFDGNVNPFLGNDVSFDGIRRCFLDLKMLLDERQRSALQKRRVMRWATRSAACCLVASVAAAVVAGVVIGAHAVVALVGMGPTVVCCGGDPLVKHRRRLRKHIAQVDASSRETYVLNNKLNTIERLVARLHSTIESDKVLIKLVIERGKGKSQHYPIMEVVRHLKKNHLSFMRQIRDLDEQIVLCLAAVNRARGLLIQQIHCC